MCISNQKHQFIHAYAWFYWIIWIVLILPGCGESTSSESQIKNRSISGRISLPTFVLVDTDVNDFNAAYAANDSETTAQVIPNPAIIGGYVNIAGAGPAGRSKVLGDIDDYYFTTLLVGQTVRLTIGDPGGANDIDLNLINTQGQVFTSQRSGNIRSLTVNASGDYHIRIIALSGASDYLLNVSLDAFSAPKSKQQEFNALSYPGVDINSDFVPGEIIVKFKKSLTVNAQVTNLKGDVLRKKAGASGRTLLYELDGDPNATIISSTHTIDKTAIDSRNLKQKTLELIKELQQRPDVESARPNYIRQKLLVPNDQYYQYQWNLPLLNLPQAWDVTTGSGSDGDNVIVAVIDTGILPDHPDLQGQVLNGFDFIRDAGNAADGDGIDNNPFDEGDGINNPSSFHGTHVAGIIAAATNNNVGVAGIAWTAKIMPLRVLGKNGGTDYDIEQAVRYAAGLENDSGTVPVPHADVINLSLGGLTNSTIPPEAYLLARKAGVIIVAAAGNDSTNQLSYPAALDGVVSVSSVGVNKILAPYSNYGSTVDIAAPGGNTSVDLNRDGYTDGVLSTLALETINP